MANDRIAGSAKEPKGTVKQALGKEGVYKTPDIVEAKLESDGKTEKVEGTIQNAVGGIKDTPKGL